MPRNDNIMKYTRLTKEQFEELYQEFINFLATQAIDKAEWDKIKTEKPEVAEQELDVFSDLVWEGVLGRAEYLEHFSKNHIFLLKNSFYRVTNLFLSNNVAGPRMRRQIEMSRKARNKLTPR